MRPSAFVLLVLLALRAIGSLPTSEPAAAASATARAKTPLLALVSQSTSVAAGQHWELRVAVNGSVAAGASLRLTAYSRLTTRTAFDASLEGSEPGYVRWRSAELPVASLPRNPSGGQTVSVPVDVPSETLGVPEFFVYGQSGVYPLQVTLMSATATVIATLNTFIVFVAGSAAQTDFPKLDVSLTLPVNAPLRLAAPAVALVGKTTKSPLAPLDASTLGDLTAEVKVLRRHPGIPLDLAVTPTTVEQLAADARPGAPLGEQSGPAARAALSGLRSLVNHGDLLLPETYVNTSLPSLLAAGLASEARAQLSRGAATLDSALGVAPATATWVAGGALDPATVDLLGAAGVTRIVTPGADLSGLPASLSGSTFAHPTLLRADTSRALVFATDAGLEAHFAPVSDQVLAAEQLLAELSMIQLETPARLRGVAVVAPPAWAVRTAFLDTLLGGLQANPLVEAVTTTGLFKAVPVATVDRAPLERSLAVGREGITSLSDGPAIVAARGQISGYDTLFPTARRTTAILLQRLLVAESSDAGSSQRAALVGSISSATTAAARGITLPGSTSITLTARKGDLPLSILSNPHVLAHVELRVSSDKLIFEPFAPGPRACSRPSPSSETCQLVLSTAATTVRVPVQARTSGVFTLQVTLSSANGGLLLGSNRDTVRSTAVSGVGVILIVLSLLGLAYWWFRNIRHGRRARQLVEPGESTDGGEDFVEAGGSVSEGGEISHRDAALPARGEPTELGDAVAEFFATAAPHFPGDSKPGAASRPPPLET